MSKFRWAWAAAALALVTFAAPAEAQKPLKDVGNDLKHLGEDVLHVWTSPVRGSGKDWLGVAGTAAGFVLLMQVDEPIDDWVVRDSTRAAFRAIRFVRPGGALYGGSALAPYVAGAYVLGVAFDKPDVRDAIMGCGSSWLSNSIGRKAFWKLVGRARPSANVGHNDWQIPRDSGKAWRSFPGGHVANVMSCASFFSNRFEWGVVEPALYGLVGAVALGRVVDRGHWVSDNFVGGVLGYAIGRTVAIRQLKRKERRENPAVSAGGSDQANGFFATPDPTAVRIGWQITF